MASKPEQEFQEWFNKKIDAMGAASGIMPPPGYADLTCAGLAGSSVANAQMLQAQSMAQAQYTNALGQSASGGLGMGAQAAAAQWPHGNQYHTMPALTVVASEQPLVAKARSRINRLIEQLPMKAAARILTVQLYDGSEGLKFVVTYRDGHTLAFFNVDEFPSDADVSRVLLDLRE
jgi:hypothetical protein